MSKFISRKLFTMIITSIIALFGQKLGLDQQTIDVIGTAAVAYILGQSVVDTATAYKATPVVPVEKLPVV